MPARTWLRPLVAPPGSSWCASSTRCFTLRWSGINTTAIFNAAGLITNLADADGKEVRHPSKQGAAFLFKPGTQVGYYSNAKEGQPPDLILAARSRVAGTGRGGSGGGARGGRGN